MKITFNYTSSRMRGLDKNNFPIMGSLEPDTSYVFSGKSAIALLLRYYRQTGILKNKSEEVLVPHWLGTWVYMMMHKFCFPATTISEETKILLVYHQWGFPQNMDKIMAFVKAHNLVVIEDCAHAFESYYKGKKVGTFGDAAIFSLAKFFPSVMGGAIYSKNKKIHAFVREKIRIEDNPNLAADALKNRKAFDASPNTKNSILLEQYYAVYDKMLACPPYSEAVARNEMARGLLGNRERNFNLLKEAFAKQGYMKGLEKENVLPWIVPLFLPKKLNQKVAQALINQGIESGVFHFDLNRNMLEPDFRECIGVPVHQGISEKEMVKIISIIQKAIK